jgi:tRNA(Ile)-lysidine synthase TilS/MesJ
LIREGDRLLVGLSGGKDSLVLLVALRALQKRSPVSFTLQACTIDPTDGDERFDTLRDFCSSLGVPHHRLRVPILRMIEERAESSPCSFCANMRRGILSSFSREKGVTTLCLGHHLDDVVETALMNLFFSGRFSSFSPLTWQDRTELRVIRPLVFLEESRISAEAERLCLPVVDFQCPFSSRSMRAWVKAEVSRMSTTAPNLRYNVLRALRGENRQSSVWTSSPPSLDPPSGDSSFQLESWEGEMDKRSPTDPD